MCDALGLTTLSSPSHYIKNIPLNDRCVLTKGAAGGWSISRGADALRGNQTTSQCIPHFGFDALAVFRARPSPGGARSLALINKTGVQRLMMRSDKPQAKRFQDWLLYEVLPALEKEGTYTMREAQSVPSKDPIGSSVRPTMPTSMLPASASVGRRVTTAPNAIAAGSANGVK